MKLPIIQQLFIIACVFNQALFASGIRPAEGDTLNYTHVLFKWDQIYNARSYQLQVATNDTVGGVDPFVSSPPIDLIDTTLLVIVDDGLNWDEAYVWRIRSMDSDDNVSDWSPLHYFNTAVLPSTIPLMETTMYDETAYSPGINVFDVGGTGYTVAFDQLGNPVHLLSTDDPATYKNFRAFNWLPNGNILGAMNFGSRDPGAWEMTLDGDVVWGMTDDSGYELHNEFLKLPNGNYMGVSRRYKKWVIPDGLWVAELSAAGYTDSILYLGDDIVEFDEDSTLVWSVNMFDLYDTADYDSATWYKAQNRGYYDWIHFNAIFYDEVDDMIYLSARHLSRITKLDHSTGQIVWNMGRSEFPNGTSSDVAVVHDFDFSMQHAIEVLENRNLIFYNNDNLTGEQTQALEIEITETSPTDPNPTARIAWQYNVPDNLYTQSKGDADRLPNGNTLIAIAKPTDIDYSGRLYEVDGQGNLIWSLVLGNGKTMFAAERVPGLYAQAFSVIIPDFNKYLTTPTIFLPTGESTLEFELHNEGWLDETYDYVVSDGDGWFYETGSVDVPSAGSSVLQIEGTVHYLTYQDMIRLIVTPQHAPALADTIYMEAFSYELAIDADTGDLPRRFILHQNYPNPFNPTTMIQYDIPEASQVYLIVYDIMGREITTIVNEIVVPGYHKEVWGGHDQRGLQVPSGIYIARLVTPGYSKSIKMVLLK